MQGGGDVETPFQQKFHIDFFGTAGTGKSCLLNLLVKQFKFRSGYQFSLGVTRILQLEEHDGTIFGDSPGFNDWEITKEAAQQIVGLLKQGGYHKLIFVVTLNSGRFQPSQKAAIKAILDAIDQPVSYGIIVNKIPIPFVEHLDEHEPELQNLYAYMMAGLKWKTTWIYYFPFLDDLQKTLQFTEQTISLVPQEYVVHLEEFIHSVPYVALEASNIKDLNTENVEFNARRYEKDLDSLYATVTELTKIIEKRDSIEKKLEEKEIAELRAQHELLQKQIAAKNKIFEAEMIGNKAKYEKQLQEAKKLQQQIELQQKEIKFLKEESKKVTPCSIL